MRLLAIPVALLLLGACGRPTVDVWADTGGGWAEEPPEPRDTGEEWEEPAKTGGLVLPYTFAPNGLGVASCADAGLQTLSLTFHDRAVLEVGPWVYPCTDDELRAGDLAEGLWTVELVGELPSGVTFEARGDVYVVAGEERELPLALECLENGLDDGCGGA
jgi:hypothetical protein